jgi:hypothetical protein
MIEIKKNKKELVSIFNVVSEIVYETDINFTKNGMFIKAVAPSNHCMAVINILPKMFEKYDFTEDKVYTVNIKELCLLLGKLKKGTVKITPLVDVLKLEDDVKSFELNYFVGSKDERRKPSFPNANVFTVESAEFFDNISDLVSLSPIGRFVIENNVLNAHSKSNTVKGKFCIDSQIVCTNDKFGYYDITYIEKISKVQDIFDKVEVNYDKEIPLVIKCSNEFISFEFVLASRVEDG